MSRRLSGSQAKQYCTPRPDLDIPTSEHQRPTLQSQWQRAFLQQASTHTATINGHISKLRTLSNTPNAPRISSSQP